MNLIWLLVVVVGIVALAVAIGLVKSVLRLVVALAVGFLAGGLAYFAIDAVAQTDSVPVAAVLVVGAIAALGVLLKRN